MAANQFRPIPTLSSRQILRFCKNIKVDDPDKCWLWTGTIDECGYGRYASFLSHRISYFLATGVDPGSMVVCHSCDNPRCQNGNHFFLGTQAENIADMMKKKRWNRARGDQSGARLHPEKVARGDEHYARRDPEKVPQGPQRHNSKLTWEQVIEIRSEYKPYSDGPNGAGKMAERFGVSRGCIMHVIKNRSYTRIGAATKRSSGQDEKQEDQKPHVATSTLIGSPNEIFISLACKAKTEDVMKPVIRGPFRTIPELDEVDMRRYQSSVEVKGPDDCWPWIARKNNKGYGVFSLRHNNLMAHRVTIFIDTGINETSKGVHHSCDFPPCNNPSHLFYGTQAENMRDMFRKGRNKIGIPKS